MRITSCVPLGGHGVVARHGGLAVVSDGLGPGRDPMLRAMAETIAEAGDGGQLVLKVARAAGNAHDRAGWACAGVTDDGALAVLVHGHAVATVSVDDGPEVTLTVGDSRLPVSRTFAGASVTVILVLAGADAPDDRFWLGNGVVQGGGLAVTATVDRPAVVDHPPTMATPAAGSAGQNGGPADGSHNGSPQPNEVEEAPAGAVLVDGTVCGNGHFTDPAAPACLFCGAVLPHPPQFVERRPRPSLGELVFDDGLRVPLDSGYVVGREPTLDGEVLAGHVRPLLINDPNGTVSRLHLKISLVRWNVEVTDLGSANGSAIQTSGDERPLTPFEPAVVEPGAQIHIGHRSMHYVSYQGARR
jgi:hypothetical protein